MDIQVNNLTEYALNRLKEPSTWRGIISLAMAAGIGIHPELMEQIISAGVAAVGLILTFKKDARSPDS